MTLEQAKNLKHGEILYHKFNRNADGTPQRWRVNGKVQTWKRSPERVRVPIKCGLYLHDEVNEKNLNSW